MIPIRFVFGLFVLLLFAADFNLCAQTTVGKQGNEWVLLVDGQPFDVKGVTFGYNEDVDNYDVYFQELKFLGVNSIRTWGTHENTPQLLDAAERDGIKVMLGNRILSLQR